MSSLFPWLDLPTPITELILERLPPSDYIRFGSVCKKWHSIQRQHRIRHSPFPPPMLKQFPLLVPADINNLLRCYSPFEQKCYPFFIPKSRLNKDFFASSHGWFFFIDDDVYCLRMRISLFNPVSKSLIKLPSLLSTLTDRIRGVLSTSPLSPNCVALILDNYEGSVYLCWLGQKQPKWEYFELFIRHITYSDCVYCNGKFYIIADTKHFFVIDSIFTTPTIKALIMDRSKVSSFSHQEKLVEFDGEVLLIMPIHGPSYNERFEVVKADFSRMMWVKEKNIRDLAFFVGEKGSLCMRAADVGCKSNCVYVTYDAKSHFSHFPRAAWSVFDMNPRRRHRRWWSSGPLPHGYVCFDHWFLPSLDYNV